jgi:hypothetical protein
MQFLLAVIAGVLLFNAVPHLVQGICGREHMTPLARKSSALVNVIWGWINLVAGALVAWVSSCQVWGAAGWLGFCLGGIGVSVYLAVFWSNPEARLPWHKD